jgi:hypothetical protein
VKPETEYAARQLAGLVLTDDGRSSGSMDRAGRGDVTATIEMRGMVQTIRRHILLDHVRVAAKVADEIERQTGEVNIDALIAESVRQEVARTVSHVDSIVRDAVKRSVEFHIAAQVEKAARVLSSDVINRLLREVSK